MENMEKKSEDDKLYVAVGKDLNRSKSTLLWALHNSMGKGICILHVHQPSQWIPMMGTKFLPSQLDEHQVRKYRDIEREAMNKLLQTYNLVCDKAGVQASTSYIEMNSIEKGIVELITQNGIGKLVMGAAADKYYTKKMLEPKSKKAVYVCQTAPSTCQIWFICKGNLVHTRKSRLDGPAIDVTSLISQSSPSSEPVESNFSRSQSVMEGPNGQLHIPYSEEDYHSRISETPRVENLYLSPSSSREVSNWDEITEINPFVSVHSQCSISSSSDVVDVSSLPHQIEYHHRHSPPPSVLGSGNYISEQMRKRKQAEEALAWGNEELEMMKQQLNETIEELCDAKEQEKSLEKQIAISERTVHELEQKMFSSVELLQKYKMERDELEKECENAIKVATELKKKQSEDALSNSRTQFFSEFSQFEIQVATNFFDESLKIWEGGYDIAYKGFLRHTQVVVKISHVPSDFEQEVSFLSKLRHPNLLTLIGACPEYSALVYEYLPNGTLEDRLNCKDNSPPLSWQTRIRIASELCSVLIFLHLCNPHSISHGDLNPSNILLDTNHVSKLCDFRLNRIFVQDKALKSTIFCCVHSAESTLAYIDPEFVASQELTAESDVYSFGVILMRLLINKSAHGIIEKVQSAFDDGSLNNLLDHTAGDWPFVQVKQLAHLAIRCCETNSKNRPDLAYEVSRVFETMLVSCGDPSTRLSSDDHRHIPHYFVCPIFQEIMEDPHVAADGFTYELEALRGWLDSGHDTSPMTNLKLPHHNLVPNRALRSAIQEWQQNK